MQLTYQEKVEVLKDLERRLTTLHVANNAIYPKLPLGLCNILGAILRTKHNYHASNERNFELVGLPYQSNKNYWWHPQDYHSRLKFIKDNEPFPF